MTASFLARIAVLLLLMSSIASGLSTRGPNVLQKALLKTGYLGKHWREQVVERYFEGVRRQDYDMIESCFGDQPTIRDVCALSLSKEPKPKTQASPQLLKDRCKEFLTAHPDTTVDFHYPPTCGRGKSRWVVAHWYENGTWKGESCGLAPANTPLNVEGQTRFFVNDDLKITDMVVTRTFSDWENQMLAQRQESS